MRDGEPRNVSRFLGALVTVPVVIVSLVAFLLVAFAAGLATACVWTWRTVSPARSARPVPTLPHGSAFGATPATDTTTDPSSRRDGPATTASLTLARDRGFGYDL